MIGELRFENRILSSLDMKKPRAKVDVNDDTKWAQLAGSSVQVTRERCPLYVTFTV